MAQQYGMTIDYRTAIDVLYIVFCLANMILKLTSECWSLLAPFLGQDW